MSAIAAIFMRNGAPASRDTAERMRNAQRLYGADRDAVRASGSFGISWNHAIGFTPQDRNEVQPMPIGTRWQMLFAGRLDHREDLAAALGIEKARLATISDGELAKAAWERWRNDAPDHLFGSYSYIVCDLEEQRLEAVRGPLRSPPLHWCETGDFFAIASMPKGLFALPDIPREIDEQKIADFLVLNQEGIDASFFKGICSLPLGHRLVANRDRVAVSRFYSLENCRDVRFANDAEYVEAAQDLLDKAVESAMRSVETPSLALSSGLDSTAVAVTALDALKRRNDAGAKPLLGLTAIPDPDWDGRVSGRGRQGDESGPVRALAARYPEMRVEFIGADDAGIDGFLDKIHLAGDMPVRGVGNMHWGAALSRRARQDGRRVQLSGASGNGTLSISGARFVFGQWLRQGRVLRAAHEWRRFGQSDGNNAPGGWKGFAGIVANALLPDGAFDRYQQWRHGGGFGWRALSAIHPEHARAMQVEKRMEDMGWQDTPERMRSHRALMSRMLDSGGRHSSGAMMLAHRAVSGIETRDPLGDRRIVEFCYGIPGDQYFRSGTDRWLIRRMMADRLPREILSAPKGVQSADWLVRLKRDAERLDSEFERLGNDPTMAARLDIDRLRSVLATLPDRTPVLPSDYPDMLIARLGLGRGLSVARFVRMIEGRND